MTIRQLITDALRMLSVLDASQSVNAEDAALGLSELNDLMSDLNQDGVDIGYVAQTNVSNNFPCSDAEAAQIKPMLAMRLYTYYPSASMPQTLAVRAENALKQLLRDAVLQNMEEASMTNIPLGEGYQRSSSILTDD